MKRVNQEKDLMKDEKGNLIEIPVEGNLGLLAAGYKGVMVWRRKRIEVAKESSKQAKSQGQSESNSK